MKCECEDTMPKCWYDEHRKKECSHRKLICPYCNAEIVAKLMEVPAVFTFVKIQKGVFCFNAQVRWVSLMKCLFATKSLTAM